MPPRDPRVTRPLLTGGLALFLLTGCDDPAQLAQEVAQAQGECSQDSLKVASEECVQMFQRYAEMATEAMHGYIGGMKALDQALRRMPPANFDTSTFGRVLTPPDSLGGTLPIDSLAGTALPGAPSLSYARERGGRFYPEAGGAGWDDRRDPRDPRYGRDPRDLRFGRDPRDPRYGRDPRYAGDPRAPGGYYPADPRYPGGGRPGPDPRQWQDPRYPDSRWDGPGAYRGEPGYPPGYGEYPERGGMPPPGAVWEEEEEELQGTAPAPPAGRPGVLLPPDQRLGRPWLRSERDARANPRHRAGPPTASPPLHAEPPEAVDPRRGTTQRRP